MEGLIAAGGCWHTPDPFKACDTCGREAIPGKVSGAVAYDFLAETVDGNTFEKRDILSVKNLPLDRVCRLRIKTDDPRYPMVTIGCDPRKGERLMMFTRHAVRLATRGPADGRLSVLVVEVRRLQDDSFTRLYLHPTQGPILTTEDLYF